MWPYFQRAENVPVGSSVNPNELGCQNTIKTIWSPPSPQFSVISAPFETLGPRPARTEATEAVISSQN